MMFLPREDKAAAIKTLLAVISSPYPSTDSSTPHPIDLPHTSRLYKILLQGGHFNRATGTIDTSQTHWDSEVFARSFVAHVGRDVVVSMCTKGAGNGAFVISALCEALVRGGEGCAEERKRVKEWFGGKVVKEVETGEAKGKKVLVENLALL